MRLVCGVQGPRTWVMAALYILVTVLSGYPLVLGLATCCALSIDPEFSLSESYAR